MILLKRFVFYFSLILSFFFITNFDVDAFNEGWYYSHNGFDSSLFYQFSYDINAPTYNFTSASISPLHTGYPIFISNTSTFTSRTIMFSPSYSFRTNHNYTVNFWFCSNAVWNTTAVEIRNSTTNTFVPFEGKFSSVSQLPYYMDEVNLYTFPACYLSTYNFDANGNGYSFTPLFGFGRSNTDSIRISMIAFEIFDNGISETLFSDLNSRINSVQNMLNVIRSYQDLYHQDDMEQSQKQHDELMNSDADSSFNQDTSSFDNLDDAENELFDSLDVDTSDIDFDVSSYTRPFSWIWETLTSFVNSNSKILAAIVSVLILSFVGLVVGRG